MAIAGKPETLPGAAASMLENLAVVLIAPASPRPVRNQVSVEVPTGQRCRLLWPIRGRMLPH